MFGKHCSSAPRISSPSPSAITNCIRPWRIFRGHGPVSVPGESARQECFVSRRGATELDFLLNKIGGADMPVLIQGETGKRQGGVRAGTAQRSSPRATETFPETELRRTALELVESELFGYERGAFTGALQKKPGMFELADGGTLLLDEIGDMDFRLQAKLLQVLQDQEFYRIGGKDPVRVDVRVSRRLTATWKKPSTKALPRGSVLPAECPDDPRTAASRAAG